MIEAADGAEALETLSSTRRPDLIVTDLSMPELDGFGFISSLRGSERLRSVPVIVLSAVNDYDSRQRLLELGCEVWIDKPFVHKELLDAVESLLG